MAVSDRYSADADGIAAAAAAVRDGGLAIYPTETCYGIGCDATNGDAVEQVYAAKQRPKEKGLTAIVADLAMAERYCRLCDTERRMAEKFMPGPLTLVAERTDAVPDTLNADFAFRVPGSEAARRLCRDADTAVVATSANISGEGPHYRVDDIAPAIQDAADIILDAGRLERTPPSTVVQLRDGEIVMHREGPITHAALEAVVDG